MRKIAATVSDRHVEIMRDDLSEVFYDATRDLGLLAGAAWLVGRLPSGLSRAASKLAAKGVRLHDSVALKDYSAYRTVLR
ncbi:hypothetical protein JYK22_37260, partial [Nonomuraea sp. RK-328]|nr:hypothetical protein [Nonomuraea sp. RK-328]